jgi:hypothetical protein
VKKGGPVSDEWMDHVRWSYVRGIKQLAQNRGYALVGLRDPGPDSELEGYLESEWGSEDAEPELYLLLEQATGERLFAGGATLGQIEDFLTAGSSDEGEVAEPPSG